MHCGPYLCSPLVKVKVQLENSRRQHANVGLTSVLGQI